MNNKETESSEDPKSERAIISKDRKTTVSLNVNGETYTKETEDRKLLVHFLREDLGLTGTHQGCEVGKCGACTVLHQGVPKKSCMIYAVQVDGEEITTVEGLSEKAEMDGVSVETREGTTMHPIQLGFKRNHGLQCGFCTPGFLLTSYALLQENEEPSRDDIESALSGNICRCTGYSSIIDSVEWASKALQDDDFEPLADGGVASPDRNIQHQGDPFPMESTNNTNDNENNYTKEGDGL